MDVLAWIGAALSAAGLATLLWCIWQAIRARRGGLDDAALRARLQRLVAWNLGALGVSTLGLLLIVFAILLG